ncbi:MAG: hypothetical protein K2G10_00245, partial [Alistipes sp.]|nr:hypothetical protein [Alistipes sp.]
FQPQHRQRPSSTSRGAGLGYKRQGLSLAQARRLQIEGFAGDVVRRCGLDDLGEGLMEAVARKMERM